jgi:hypothetical protein
LDARAKAAKSNAEGEGDESFYDFPQPISLELVDVKEDVIRASATWEQLGMSAPNLMFAGGGIAAELFGNSRSDDEDGAKRIGEFYSVVSISMASVPLRAGSSKEP